MKKLEVPEEFEQVVGNVCDALLKSAGLAAHATVSALKDVFSKIKLLEAPESPAPKEDPAPQPPAAQQ